jgi:hypothetical protein
LRAESTLAVFEQIGNHYRALGVERVIYKAVPHVFHAYPAEEDLYALHRTGCAAERRDLSSVISLQEKFQLHAGPQARGRQGAKGGHPIAGGHDLTAFHALADGSAARHDAMPTHSLPSCACCSRAFRDRSCCTKRVDEDALLAGVLVYDFGRVVHTQYMAASEEGRQLDALSLLLAELIGDTYADRALFQLRHFDRTGRARAQRWPGRAKGIFRRARRRARFLRMAALMGIDGRPVPQPQGSQRAHADELKAAAARVIDSGWYVLGEELAAFEREFAAYCGVRHAVGVGNGLDALSLILRGYKELGAIEEGDEVIVPGNTFIASFLAITENRLVPVPVEPDPGSSTWIRRVEAAIGPRTRAIMAVHLYGQLADMPALAALARRHKCC